MRKLRPKEIKRMSVKIGTTVCGLFDITPDVACILTPSLCFNMWASMSPEPITKKKTRDILNKKEARVRGKAFIYFSHGVFYPIMAQILPLHHHFPSLFIPSPKSFSISCLPLSWTGNKGAFSFHLSGKEALGPSDFSEWNTTKGTFFSFFSC